MNNFEIIKTTHTRKGFELWVVKIKERVPKPVFMDLLTKAKKHKGWYSSYNYDGSIPGFQFKNKEAVNNFISTAELPEQPQQTEQSPKRNTQYHEKQKPKESTPATEKQNFTTAKSWERLADSYQAEADKKYKELQTQQSNTPKRMREYNSKRVDADILSDMAAMARGLSLRHMHGTLPKALAILEPVKSKGHLSAFVAGHHSEGYYDARRAHSPSFLQQKSVPGIKGIKTFEQANEIYNLLLNISDTSEEERNQHERNIKIKELEDQVRFADIDGFFPTPKPLIEKMVRALGIKPGDLILEPSAGMGSMIEVIAENYPDNEIGAFEINHTLSKLIRAKGFKCVNDDFLNFPVQADRILMNPPFEKWKDIDHVQHAYNCLKPGGRLISIMGAGAFQGSTKKHIQFLNWIDQVGAEYFKLPEDAFKSAFRPTRVQTYQIIIDKY
jgi:hypothetical protein